MKNLTIRTAELLLTGARVTGSFTEAYFYVEEELYISEAPEVYDFCKFIDKYLGGAGSANIRIFWRLFKQDAPAKMIEKAEESIEALNLIH